MNVFPDLFNPAAHTIVERPRQRSVSQVRRGAGGRPTVQAASLTPAQRLGLRYERMVGQRLSSLAQQLGAKFWDHEWLEYVAGPKDEREAQPDYVMVFPSRSAILFEIKYTWTDCTEQLRFYSMLLEELHYGPVTPVVVCRNLTVQTPRESIIHDFNDISPNSVWQLRV